MLSKSCKYLLLLEALQDSVKKCYCLKRDASKTWSHTQGSVYLVGSIFLFLFQFECRWWRYISEMHKRHLKLATSNQGDQNLEIPQELRFWFQSLVLTQSWNILGEALKKPCFFTFSQKTETPSPPPLLTTSVFSDKDFLDWARPPSPLNEKNW